MTAEFRSLDIAAILVYLAGMAVVGVYFARRNKSTEDYFVGNRDRFDGWTSQQYIPINSNCKR